MMTQKIIFPGLVAVLICLLNSCIQSNEIILGAPCFTLEKDEHFIPTAGQALEQYNHIADSVLRLPGAPLHRAISAKGHQTYIAMPLTDDADSLAGHLLALPGTLDSRKDSLGQAFLLNYNQQLLSLFLHETGNDYPLLFITQFQDQQLTRERFANEEYYSMKLKCR